MNFLTGSAPKATFSTQPTVLPQQIDIIDRLNSILSGNFSAFQAPETTSLTALENQAAAIPSGPTPAQTGINSQAFNTLQGALGFKAPTVSATNVTAPQIDATAAFQKGVVDPMTTDFLQKTLPSIAGAQGGSAGGAYSSGAGEARRQAASDFERNVAGVGSQFAYDASKANQAAALSALLANQTAGLQAGVANQGAAISSNDEILKALGLSPAISSLPTTQLAGDIGLTTTALGPFQQMIADMIAGGTGATVQTSGVGTGGSTGLLGGLLGGVGSVLGASTDSIGGSILSSIFSDRRMKEDIEEVGSVDGFPLYRFRYKGRPERYVGVMAQDVEKRVPAAVVTMPSGYKAVNYAALVEGALKEVA